MFANRLIRNILYFLIPFILAVNVYFWTTAISFDGEFKYVGFYAFFKNFEKMPKFEFVVDSVKVMAKVVSNWSGQKIALNIALAGIPFLVEFTVNLTELLVCILIDIIRIFIWLFGFLGIDMYHGGIVSPQ